VVVVVWFAIGGGASLPVTLGARLGMSTAPGEVGEY
jgi:hypothetical protein